MGTATTARGQDREGRSISEYLTVDFTHLSIVHFLLISFQASGIKYHIATGGQ